MTKKDAKAGLLQARVDQLEDMEPDETGKMQEYLGGHGLRVQVNKAKPNTWSQVVSTAPSGKQTSMKLGYTKRVSFADAERIGDAIAEWARTHTMAECKDAAERFRVQAKTEQEKKGRVSQQRLDKAWRKVVGETDCQQLVQFKYSENGGAGRSKGGGEGRAHKKLKEYVKRTPWILGLPRRAARAAECEYGLPSGDSVDVMFCNDGHMIAVEVKPKTSDIGDIRRGLFQCVKYKAVTEAAFKDNGREPHVRSVLVLGGSLPSPLKATRKRLGVEVKENIRPS